MAHTAVGIDDEPVPGSADVRPGLVVVVVTANDAESVVVVAERIVVVVTPEAAVVVVAPATVVVVAFAFVVVVAAAVVVVVVSDDATAQVNPAGVSPPAAVRVIWADQYFTVAPACVQAKPTM
ncbi:unannotated protein [freshwater metagenome]|uniref:Unannotated protein n=1 Tax=freshwater metagenome TaxID=449393 RepID=A0A6J7F343_9ZZZZ